MECPDLTEGNRGRRTPPSMVQTYRLTFVADTAAAGETGRAASLRYGPADRDVYTAERAPWSPRVADGVLVLVDSCWHGRCVWCDMLPRARLCRPVAMPRVAATLQ